MSAEDQVAVYFSVIVPLYNRPSEIDELLESLTRQTFRDFEVIIIEDGSTVDAKLIVEAYSDQLAIQYEYIPNGGQGFARNKGFSLANGEFFIVFDSDCVIPPHYLQVVYEQLKQHRYDAFGGPDAAHESFSDWQKAVSYAMTSPLTTGGIRGNKRHVGVFHPRSFNMGISREVWEVSGGFRWTNKSEDMEFSMRIRSMGFQVGLIPSAYVYHKRRTNFQQFFKQTFSFGEGRIRLYHAFKSELKWVHMLPSVFVLGLVALLLLRIASVTLSENSTLNGGASVLFQIGSIFLLLYTLSIFIHSWLRNKSWVVALLSVPASYCQLIAYGTGFLNAMFKRNKR